MFRELMLTLVFVLLADGNLVNKYDGNVDVNSLMADRAGEALLVMLMFFGFVVSCASPRTGDKDDASGTATPVEEETGPAGGLTLDRPIKPVG